MMTKTKVQLVSKFERKNDLNVYYVLDKFNRTWSTVARSENQAQENIRHGEDTLTFKLYTTSKLGESLPRYDFKTLILNMLRQMGLMDTYESQIVNKWNDYECLTFMKKSTLYPHRLLLEINKFDLGGYTSGK